MERRGVLLYYQYVPLGPETTVVAAWFERTCSDLGLRGRIRVAQDGINVTLSGRWDALLLHVDAIKAHPLFKDKSIDFKLAESSMGSDGVVMHETGFDNLAVRLCKELVTLGPLAQGRADAATNAGEHLSPQQFHQLLQEAGDGGGSGKETVLIDARNIYETSIGHFEVPGVPLLDPQTRCFSDLPAWLDRMEHRLKGRRLLMYCTGGVRCERASAYLREKGPGFEDVYQLSGGIQRYLEAFSADGGFFRGKNFVYDDRISVGPGGGHEQQDAANGVAGKSSASCEADEADTAAAGGGSAEGPVNSVPVVSSSVVGRCITCACPWDDYSNRARCSRCRMLVLLCNSCRQQQSPQQQQGVLCALCGMQSRRCHSRKARRRAAAERATAEQLEVKGAQAGQEEEQACASSHSTSTSRCSPISIRLPGGGCAVVGNASQGPQVVGGEAAPQGRLRILCLHGFRQTGYKLMGRTCGVRKHLDDIADFYFADAPHLLPHFFKRAPGFDNPSAAASAMLATEDEAPFVDLWQGDSVASAATTAAAATESTLASGHQRTVPQPQVIVAPAAHKRAWLVPSELAQQEQQQQLDAAASGVAITNSSEGDWQPAPEYIDEEQYMRQVQGWNPSWQSLQAFIRKHGPFQGVLGFSQGAAVAAVLCAMQQQQSRQRQQQQQQEQQKQHQEDCDEGSSAAGVAHDALQADVQLGFEFAILASGYRSRCPEHEQLFDAVGPLLIPSLHVFGGSAAAASADTSAAAPETGQDRQVSAAESEALAALFEATAGRRIVRHGQGHVLPCKRSVIQELRAFLLDQLQPHQA